MHVFGLYALAFLQTLLLAGGCLGANVSAASPVAVGRQDDQELMLEDEWLIGVCASNVESCERMWLEFAQGVEQKANHVSVGFIRLEHWQASPGDDNTPSQQHLPLILNVRNGRCRVLPVSSDFLRWKQHSRHLGDDAGMKIKSPPTRQGIRKAYHGTSLDGELHKHHEIRVGFTSAIIFFIWMAYLFRFFWCNREFTVVLFLYHMMIYVLQ